MWITALPPSLDFSIREIVVSESVGLGLCYVRIEIPVLEAKLLTKPVPKELPSHRMRRGLGLIFYRYTEEYDSLGTVRENQSP